MDRQYQVMCAWSGIVLSTLFGLGLWPVAHFFPPHLPTASAAEIAAIFQQNTTDIRLGMIILLTAGFFFGPFVALISLHLRRIEGASSLMANIQLIAGTATMLFFVFSPLIWTAVAFRPERAPEITQIANDLAWILFVIVIPPLVLQNLSIGFAILADKGPHPVFARWIGFFNFWMALLSVPALFCTFFKTGPFAWNGVLAFYIPAGLFFVWLFIMFFALLKAIKQQSQAI